MRGLVRIFALSTIAMMMAGCQTTGTAPSLPSPMGAQSSAASPTQVADLPPSSVMPTGVDAPDNPPGFTSFCLRFADQCATNPNSAQIATLDIKTAVLLEQVNRKVNRSIWPADDDKHYGRKEYWTIPTDGYGDCDDYAVTKRAELISAGVPERALRLAVAITPRAIRHAVLTVATDQGDYVLDSLNDEITPWSATGYQWVMRQKGDDARKWTSMEATPSSGNTAASEWQVSASVQ